MRCRSVSVIPSPQSQWQVGLSVVCEFQASERRLEEEVCGQHLKNSI